MNIGIEKAEGRYSYERDWLPREVAFNKTDTGTLVIASIPTGKRHDVMFGWRCEIHLRPDGTYWGNVNSNFVGCQQRKPRLPRLPKARLGCRHYPSCEQCPEKECIT